MKTSAAKNNQTKDGIRGVFQPNNFDEIFQSDVEHVMSSMGEDGFIVSQKEAEAAVKRSAKKELQPITE